MADDEPMEIDRVVLPLESSDRAAASTAAMGRARFAYLKQTGTAADPREALGPDYGADLGRDALKMVKVLDAGYAQDDAASESPAASDLDSDDEDPPEAQPEGSTELKMDADWNTDGWSAREIESALNALMREVRLAPLTAEGQKRRERAQTMLVRLLKRHREAVQYVERILEGLCHRGLPAAVGHMADGEPLNLAPLLAALAPVKDFSRRLLDVHAVRRACRCLARRPNLAAAIIQCRVQMKYLCDPNAGRYAEKITDDMREDEVEYVKKETRDYCRRKWVAKCWEQDALKRRWRALEAARSRHDFGSELTTRATRSHLALLEALCASPLPGVGETARRRTCGRLGEALPSICMLATRQAAEGPDIQALALRVLLLVAAQPSLVKPLLLANVADLCRSLLNVREPVGVRRAALDVLQACALSCLTCVNRPSEPPTSRPPSTRPATGAGTRPLGGPTPPGTADADRPPSPVTRVVEEREDDDYPHLYEVGDAEVGDLLATRRVVASSVELLGDRDEALFLGAIRFAQRCANSGFQAYRRALDEVLAYGGRPLERLVLGGLAASTGRGGRGAPAGPAALELLAALCARPAGRQGLRAAHVELMVAPLLSSGDPTQPHYLRSLYVLLAAARSGPDTEVVLPGALGDRVDPQADSRTIPTAPDPALAMTRHVRAAFVALSLRSDDEVAATCLELSRLGAARGCREFLTRPREKGYPYRLGRKERAAHLVVLHRLLNSAEPLPGELLKTDAAAVVRFLALGVQAGYYDVEDNQIYSLPVKDRALHHLALESALRALACAATAGAASEPDAVAAAIGAVRRTEAVDEEEDDDAMMAEEDPRLADALLEPPRGARALVAQFLLSTSLLGDVLGLVKRAPSADVAALDALAGAEARVAAAACALVAAAAPVAIVDLAASLREEPPVLEEESYVAAETTLRPLREVSLRGLQVCLAHEAPYECRAAACLALAKLSATPNGAKSGRDVARALGRLAPPGPVSQKHCDAVLYRRPWAAMANADASATQGRDVDACRFLRLPVSWFACAASLALHEAGAKMVVAHHVVNRCAERFGVASDRPGVDRAIRAHVALVLARVAVCGERPNALGPFAHVGINLLQHERYGLAPGLCKMVGEAPRPPPRALRIKPAPPGDAGCYNATLCVAALCSANVAAAGPLLRKHGILKHLRALILEPRTGQPLLRQALLALRAVLRVPGSDAARALAGSQKRGRLGKTLPERLEQLTMDAPLLDAQRGVARRVPIPHLSRDVLMALGPSETAGRGRPPTAPAPRAPSIEVDYAAEAARARAALVPAAPALVPAPAPAPAYAPAPTPVAAEAPAPAPAPADIDMATYHRAELEAALEREALRRANRPSWERTPEGSEDEAAHDDANSSASSEDDRQRQIDAHEQALADAESARVAEADAKRHAGSDVGGSLGLFLDAAELVDGETNEENRRSEEAALMQLYGVAAPREPDPAVALPAAAPTPAPAPVPTRAPAPARSAGPPFAPTMTAAECAAAAARDDATADVNAVADAWDASDDERDARLSEIWATRRRRAGRGRRLGAPVEPPPRPLVTVVALDAHPGFAATRPPPRPRPPRPRTPPPPSPQSPGPYVRRAARTMADPAFVEPVRLVDGALKRLPDPLEGFTGCAASFENVHEITIRSKVAAARAARATRDVLRKETASAFLAAPKRPQGTSILARRLQAATQRARDVSSEPT